MVTFDDYNIVVVTGDRHYSRYGVVRDTAVVLKEQFKRLIIVHGAATGADTQIEIACKELKIPYHGYPAEWFTYRKAAGPKRNRTILDLYPKIRLVMAFHDYLANSKGTRDMIEEAMRRGIEVILYKKDGPIYLQQTDLLELLNDPV